jgi:hypothetical protein
MRHMILLILIAVIPTYAVASTCTDDVSKDALPLSAAVDRVKSCEQKAKAACADQQPVKQNRQALTSCINDAVGDKSFLKISFSPTCYDQARDRKLQDRAAVAFVRDCEARGEAQCRRAAGDLALFGSAAERFSNYCKRSASGRP